MSLVERFVNVEEKGIWVHSEVEPTIMGYGDSNRSMAEMKQGIGNILFAEMQYEPAVHMYTEAIELCADISSYVARSSCNLMLHRYEAALADAKSAVSMDRNSVEAQLQRARTALALGDCPEARKALRAAAELSSGNIEHSLETTKIRTIYSLLEESDRAYAKKEYAKVIKYSDRILVRLPSRVVKLRRAECLVLLGQHAQASDIASNILILDKDNVTAMYILSMCHFYQGHLEIAKKRLKRLFELQPDHEKGREFYEKVCKLKDKKDQAKKELDANNLERSYTLYSEALGIDSNNAVTNSHLFLSRASVSFKMGNLEKVLDDCTSCLKLNRRDIPALLLRGKTHMRLRNFVAAAEDFQSAITMKDDWEIRRLLQEAKLAGISSKADYYTILGVSHRSTTAEIKRAYWKKALLHHPDKHIKAEPAEKQQQEKLFKEIAQAYDILSDPKKRLMYDNNYSFK